MRDKNQNPDELNIQLGRICRKKNLQSLRLTEAVFVNPNLEYRITIGPLPRTLWELKALILISYFCDDEAVGFFLREEIREHLHFSLEDSLSLEILLCGEKNVVLNYFYLNEEISNRTFFGNLVPLGIELFNNLRFIRRKLGPVVKPVYRRGYKDKGSLRPVTKWLPSYDWTFVEEQNRRERIKDQYSEYLKQVLELLRNLN